MEWMHFEPLIHEKATAALHNNINKKNEKSEENNVAVEENNATEKLNCDNMIHYLKTEDIRLRNIIKRLKYRLRTAQKCRKPKGQKQNKQIIKELIDKQPFASCSKSYN